MTATTKPRVRKTPAPKAPAPSTDVVATEPVIEGTIHEGPIPTDAPTDAPTTDEVPTSTEARITALKALWAKGTEDEELAWGDLSTARVLKSRVAYLAGALGSKNGEPNNKAAMRVLDLAQNTVRPYFLAGQALAKAGYEMSTNAPTQSERDIVDPIVSKAQGGRKTPKADTTDPGTSGGTGGTTGGEAGDEGSDTRPPAGAPKDPDTVILADVVSAVQELERLVNVFTRNQGFTGVAADGIGEVLSSIANIVEAHRVDGGDV